MPTIQGTTKTSEQVWKSPDGQRVLYRVVLDTGSGTVAAKTYSRTIATEGWTGEADVYEKSNPKGGIEAFVRQLQKEGANFGRTSSTGKYQPKDEAAIKAMWSIGQAVQVFQATDIPTKLSHPGRMALIENIAVDLFAMVDKVKMSKPTEEEESDNSSDPEMPDNFLQPDTVVEASSEPVDLSLVDEIFGKSKDKAKE